jgi:hypothetical protein
VPRGLIRLDRIGRRVPLRTDGALVRKSKANSIRAIQGTRFAEFLLARAG